MRGWFVAALPGNCGYDPSHKIAPGDWYLQITLGKGTTFTRCERCAGANYGEFPPPPDVDEATQVEIAAPEDEPIEVTE